MEENNSNEDSDKLVIRRGVCEVRTQRGCSQDHFRYYQQLE
jgi:hypothetical protein